jgi:hypothetical protein
VCQFDWRGVHRDQVPMIKEDECKIDATGHEVAGERAGWNDWGGVEEEGGRWLGRLC